MSGGPVAKQLGRVIVAAIGSEAEVRRDPAVAFETALKVGRAFLETRRPRAEAGAPIDGVRE